MAQRGRLLLLTLLLSSTVAHADKLATLQGDQYSATGMSDSTNSKIASEEACNNARRNLISYVFGASYQVNQQSIRTFGVVDYSEDLHSETPKVSLVGVEISVTSSGGMTRCQLSYPKKEADIEKDRLKSAKSFNAPRFADIGRRDSSRGGVLEVVSFPDGAEVYIDHKRWGITPLRLNGQLEPGQHLLRIESDSYKTVEEEVMVTANGTTQKKFILQRATGNVTIVTDPTDAVVKINGQEVGRSPIEKLELVAGQTYKLEILHPYCEFYSQSFTLSRDQSLKLPIELPTKPATLAVNSEPSEALVFIDGQQRGTTGHQDATSMKVEAGTHSVVFKKDGFRPMTVAISMAGGESKALPTVKLIPQSAPSTRIGTFELGVGSVGLTGQPTAKGITLGIASERKIASWVGFSLGYTGVFGLNPQPKGSLVSQQCTNCAVVGSESYMKSFFLNQLTAGLPIHVRKFVIAPELSYGYMSFEAARRDYYTNYADPDAFDTTTAKGNEWVFGYGASVRIQNRFGSEEDPSTTGWSIGLGVTSYPAKGTMPGAFGIIGTIGLTFGN